MRFLQTRPCPFRALLFCGNQLHRDKFIYFDLPNLDSCASENIAKDVNMLLSLILHRVERN